jgi:hypothetical protein
VVSSLSTAEMEPQVKAEEVPNLSHLRIAKYGVT